jgi:hypothetical protein
VRLERVHAHHVQPAELHRKAPRRRVFHGPGGVGKQNSFLMMRREGFRMGQKKIDTTKAPGPKRLSSRARRRIGGAAARTPVLHVVMPGCEVARAEPRPRETVTAFLRRTGWAVRDRKYGWQFKKGLPTILEINGEPVLRKFWRCRRIAANDAVRFTSYPLGGGSSGGKQVAGLVALIAVAAFAVIGGPLVAAELGLTAVNAAGVTALTTGGMLVSAAFTAGVPLSGTMLVNSLRK